MFHSADLYLGSFLVLCGFVFSILNLKRLVKYNKPSFYPVLISENVLLICIGIVFISRSIYHMNPTNIRMYEIEERTANITKLEDPMPCNFLSILRNYGPLIISLVNSFLSLVIDNYMHYRMLADTKAKVDENTVEEISCELTTEVQTKVNNKYITLVIIGSQWIIPAVLAMALYSVNIEELISTNVRNLDESCINILDLSKGNCSTNYTEYELEFRNYIPSKNYLFTYENEPISGNKSKEMDYILTNVYKILANLKNDSSQSMNVTSGYLHRNPKSNKKCMKVCYMENKNLLLYMFMITIASYFIPVTISMVILTKIHVMDVKHSHTKTFMNRELLYNVLFWSPVIFDTFLSLLVCSYSMNGMRTSIFNIIANVYQAVKNLMNMKHFNDNSVTPMQIK